MKSIKQNGFLRGCYMLCKLFFTNKLNAGGG